MAGADARYQSLQNMLMQWTIEGTDILIHAESKWSEVSVGEFEV